MKPFNLFCIDNHGVDKAEFFEAKLENTFLDLVKSHYPFLDFSEIKVVGKTNLNSKNYKIGDYYLKVLSNLETPTSLTSNILLTEILKKNSIPCVDFVKNKDGNLFTQVNGDYFFIQEYFSDEFYSGDEEQFIQCLSLVEDLISVNFQLESIVKRSMYLNWNPEEEFKKIEVEILKRKSKDELEIFVAENLEFFKLQIEKISSRASEISIPTTEISHVDIHPHNLLFKDGNLKALIDLDGFSRGSCLHSYSFGIFKLARKSISKNRMTIQKAIEVMGNYSFKPSLLSIETELTRRILIILNLHYLQDNSEWNQDLLKHFYGIFEARELFHN